jgi:hypothetical protein
MGYSMFERRLGQHVVLAIGTVTPA